MRKMKQETKKNIVRIIMLFMAFVMLMGFVLMPLTSTAYAQTADGVVTDVVVSSFETGKLSDAIDEAKNGTDLNLIKKIAVSGGTLSAADYSAICGYPNVEFIELAGCDTENGVIPDNCMQSRNQLSYISLPANTVTIGSRAFSGNRNLLKVSIPSTLRNIGDYAFEGCEKIEEISVPAELKTLGTGAFSDCKALKGFALPQAITEIPDYCFAKCSFTEMHFGPQITRIGDGAFSDCHSLTDIYFYGTAAPEANQSAFQNLKVTIHTYANSDTDGFGALENNFVTIGYDLSEDSVYEPPKAAVTEAAEQTQTTASSESESAAESESTVTSTEEAGDSADTVQMTAQSEIVNVPAQSGAFSGTSVIVIGILCAALAVAVTLLVVNKKNSK